MSTVIRLPLLSSPSPEPGEQALIKALPAKNNIFGRREMSMQYIDYYPNLTISDNIILASYSRIEF